jgi:hypothetical protein
MIYVPVRNLFLKRVVSGRLRAVSAKVTEKGRPLLSIQLDQHRIVVPEPGDLESALNQDAVREQEIRITLGAFNRVLRVEKIH